MSAQANNAVRWRELQFDRFEQVRQVIGESDAVQQAVNKYFKDYHPAGYGTNVQRDFTNQNGERVVQIHRFQNCD